MSDLLQNINATLGNPVVKTALRTAAPQAALAIEVVGALAGSLFAKKGHSAAEVIRLVDKRFGDYIAEMVQDTTSAARRRELEIRIHELLGVLDEWDKID